MSKISLEEALAENEALKDTIAIILAQKNDYRKKLEEVKKQLSELKEELNKPENKVFKPKIGDWYYYINDNGEVSHCRWEDDIFDHTRYAIGNCFITEKEAEFAVEKLKVIAELKRFAEEHNELLDWNNREQCKFAIRYNYLCKRIDWDYYVSGKCNDIYFSSKEIVEEAIKEIGKDRIKKYYLGVEDDK